ncbi:MAG: NADH-quinone oxidoreductase subunit NuoK [Verrucomicrobiota bacterium]|nr:NADH-quinone oxidoreductase subunit NuoK [Verrucomicrobiota bacterium]
MSVIGLHHYLIVSALLFCIGLGGVMIRRNVLIIYMCLEIMLNAGSLALVAFSHFNGAINGQILVFFVITVAAAEVALGLAIIVAYYRLKQSTHVDDMTSMKF